VATEHPESSERFEQRRADLQKAVIRLEEACAEPESSFLRDSVIQRFEFCWELAWKMLKLQLAYLGIEALSPRDVIRQSLQAGLIGDGEVWTEAQLHRNMTSATYEEPRAGFAPRVGQRGQHLANQVGAAMQSARKVNPASGLSEQILSLLRQEISRFPEVRAAYLYGSRARGNYTPRSDIDIAIDAPAMTQQAFAQLWSALQATPIAYPLDCVWLQALPESALKEQIRKEGRPV
jgi:nucleotidyltransferase substrate binding protein (TIGR01987 family)